MDNGWVAVVDDGKLIERDQVISGLRDALYRGKHGLTAIPGLLKRVLREDMWQERLVIKTKQVERFNDFKKFVETPPLEGLGASLELLERICKDDSEARDLLCRVQGLGEHGGDRKSEKVIDQGDNGTLKRGSNQASYLIRRLQRDYPHLADKLALGEIKSARAAAIEAGIVKVPSALDIAIKAYLKLSAEDREKFNYITQRIIP